jgi:hypothetical protein
LKRLQLGTTIDEMSRRDRTLVVERIHRT